MGGRIAACVALGVLVSSGAVAETSLYWGDTHLHTSYSGDAYMAGNRDATPDVAYRVAKGEPVIHPFTRTRVQLRQPLDFLVIADHVEDLGILSSLNEADPDMEDSWFWERWKTAFALSQLRDLIRDPLEGTAVFVSRMPEPQIMPGDTKDPLMEGNPPGVGLTSGNLFPAAAAHQIMRDTWAASMDTADAHYEPGVFTPIVGWEWTQRNNGVNLHRVVMSTISGEDAKDIDPIGRDNAFYPEDLWNAMDDLSEATGARFLAIPHNSNISKGYMFGEITLKGEPITTAYAELRARWEPVVEVTQFKGDSETHPSLSPDDPFADFETYPFYLQRPPQGGMYAANVGDYARSALRRGLELEARLGVNPYQFGMIGSTDSHTGIASAEEPNFWGKLGSDSLPENKRAEGLTDDTIRPGIDMPNGWSMSAQGLAAAWATENTREGIFDAFMRREVYATTGPRIALRVFGGWNFDATASEATDIAEPGYAGGVPMGGDLSNAPEGAAPQLLIRATRDPLTANLDRVQVVKGWLDADGTSRERVYNVAWSGERALAADGSLPAIANTVNLRTGETPPGTGSPELSTVWTDPDFDATQSAFYYVRVLQVPTARHSTLDAIALGLDELPFEGPATLQERAYSSPIWYKPVG